MALPTHNLLNRVLPVGLRGALRQLAILGIPTMRHLDMRTRLRQLAGLGFSPRIIYDIGAAEGAWARMAHGVWPSAAIIGFEPNASRVPALEKTRAAITNFRFIRGFLGASRGEVRYSDKQDQTSLLFKDESGPGSEVAPMHVLDDLIARGEVPPPDFMKLDVQGYELEVLKGGRTALSSCQGVLLEVNVYHLSADMPTAPEVIAFMRDAGFFWYDIVGVLRRGADDALAHMDFLFLKNNHRLIRDSWE